MPFGAEHRRSISRLHPIYAIHVDPSTGQETKVLKAITWIRHNRKTGMDYIHRRDRAMRQVQQEQEEEQESEQERELQETATKKLQAMQLGTIDSTTAEQLKKDDTQEAQGPEVAGMKRRLRITNSESGNKRQKKLKGRDRADNINKGDVSQVHQTRSKKPQSTPISKLRFVTSVSEDR